MFSNAWITNHPDFPLPQDRTRSVTMIEDWQNRHFIANHTRTGETVAFWIDTTTEFTEPLFSVSTHDYSTLAAGKHEYHCTVPFNRIHETLSGLPIDTLPEKVLEFYRHIINAELTRRDTENVWADYIAHYTGIPAILEDMLELLDPLYQPQLRKWISKNYPALAHQLDTEDAILKTLQTLIR